jgi:glycosyltransferase involved in cell wall biosynthesis
MKISVAICTFNGAAFIDEQIRSILSQSRPVDEIVCCDDGSEDETREILEKYSLQHPGLFTIIRNQQTLGPRKNFEKAIVQCTGGIIFLCDQDDIWLSYKVERMLAAFDEKPNVLGLFSNGWLIGERGENLDETMWDALYYEQALRQHSSSSDLFYYILLNGNIATGTAMAFRKEAIPFITPFFTGFNTWHDHWIALVLSAMDQLDYIDQPLLQYRVHSNQQVGFPGRKRSNEQFRSAVHLTWLKVQEPASLGTQAAHIAWALQTYENYAPELEKRIGKHPHLIQTGDRLRLALQHIKRGWFKQTPILKRKIRLMKHWLKGGEYLRITVKDLFSI